MSKPIIVLKFGGSVLTSEEAVGQAVVEVYRYVRSGFAVVVVVSALKGVTDHLIALARQFGATAHDPGARYLLATGEYQSAALLSLASKRVGLSSVILQPHEIGLLATGEPDDAAPTSIDARALRAALAINDLVVVPGFVALDPRGSTVLLGRGGTDLSAVFIATRLEGARVRLLKDVDAIFDRDPAKSGGGARAFAKLDWQTAARIAHPVVQNKAVQLAAEHGLEIEVAALGRGYETVIGSSTKVRSGEGARRPARVAILGCGVVGGGVVERLSQECDSFELVSILIKDPTSRAHHPSRSLFTTDPALLLERGCDIFVDAGSGVEPSRTLVEEFLRRGVPVVSANKLAVVSYLTSGAHRLPDNDQRFLYSAAVGGGAPFLEATGRARGNIRSVEGVLNGTTNYVIDRFQVTSSLEVAIREAQHAGFAEADPGSDLSGSDAAAKIRLIGMAASGSMPPEPEICEALTAEVLESVGDGVLKQVARWEVGRDGEPVCAVRLRRLSADHFLAGARAEENRIEIKLRSGRTIRVAGRGAGRYPTTEAVMADLFETFRGLSAAESGEPLT